MLAAGSNTKFQEFLGLNDDAQRLFLNDKTKCQDFIRLLFEIIEKIKGDSKLVTLALLLIDGILEDSRQRITNFIAIQKSQNKTRQMDLIGVLLSFCIQSSTDNHDQRDVASHILSMLIEAYEYHNCEKQAMDYLNWLLEMKALPRLSHQAYTFNMMYMVKTNELAKEFVDQHGFELLARYLEFDCLEDHQIAYNVICTLWIISYHAFALKGFEDYRLNIIEKVSKVLDYFNKEKIVRIILLLFENIKENTNCLELLSDINAINIVSKLQNRHWVDTDITEMLEKLYQYLDENYQAFSSIEKFHKECNKRVLKWGPVHTEKFWQENFFHFQETDNLELIKVLLTLLEDSDDRVKAIACYDLGEFARFVPFGRQFLEKKGLKEKIIELMGRPNSTAELKKEAITCYQKLLMNSWSSTEFK